MKNFLFISALILTFSCNKTNCNSSQKTNGTGEIISNAVIEETAFTGLGFRDEYVIKSDSANTINARVRFNNGSLDSINFNDYSLLGKWADGDCSVRIERDVEKKSSEKKLIYTIKVNECGNCKVLEGSMNWVLVPKIPNDYVVEFIVN